MPPKKVTKAVAPPTKAVISKKAAKIEDTKKTRGRATSSQPTAPIVAAKKVRGSSSGAVIVPPAKPAVAATKKAVGNKRKAKSVSPSPDTKKQANKSPVK